MRARAHARLVSLAALLPLVVVAVSGYGYDRMRCPFTGQVSEMSEGGCCPAEDPPAIPAANGASCCDHESARTVRLPAEATAPREVAVVATTVLPAFNVLRPPAPPTLAPRAVSNWPPPTPLVLVKQSFLI